MNKSKELDVKVKFGLKSFITVVAILMAVLIAVQPPDARPEMRFE